MAKQRTVIRILLTAFLSVGCQSQSLDCGRASLNARIVGGVEASPGSWPWMVSLRVPGRYMCGASLINKQWVLTAAHCMDLWSQGVPYFASMGRHNFSDPNPNQVERQVRTVHMHPRYDNKTLDYDICLLELESSVSFSPFVQPVCLAARGSTLHSRVDAWVAGWGDTEEYGDTDPFALQEVSLPIVGENECRCSHSSPPLSPNIICAGLSEGGKDACQGDSGGPLVVKQDLVWVQAGVVSLGDGCARPKRPGVYSDVSRYQDWIEGIVTPGNRLGFVNFTSPGKDQDKNFSCPTNPAPTTDTTPTTVTTTTTTTTAKYSKTTDDNSIFGHAENTKAQLSQLLPLCALALLLFLFG